MVRVLKIAGIYTKKSHLFAPGRMVHLGQLPMRFAALVVAFAIAVPAFAQSDALRRKSGLWHVKKTGDHWPPPGLESLHCVDRATDEFLGEPMGTCGEPKVQRQGSNFVLQSSCKFNGSTQNHRIVVSGNLDSAYTIQWATFFRPPVQGMPDFRTTFQATWVGAACNPGMTPGESTVLEKRLAP